MATAAEYVSTDEHGVMRVGQTRVMLDSVLASFVEGCSAETILQHHPSLSLEKVYRAITFYLGNRETMDAYLVRQDAVWSRAREAVNRSAKPSRRPAPNRSRAGR
jgi:uncharacterized protein (DUF433 family)